MSEAPPHTRPAHRKRVGQLAEGITFVITIGMITTAHSSPIGAAMMAAAVLWTIFALALPLCFPGGFTFAIPRSLSQEKLERSGVPEPRFVSALPFMSFVLGMDGANALWGPHFFVGLAYAALLGAPLFALAYTLDPRMRTARQMIYLAVAALLWGLGTVAAILGLFFA